MSETPDADVILPSGAKPDACFGEDEDSDSCFELEGCFDGDEDQDELPPDFWSRPDANFQTLEEAQEALDHPKLLRSFFTRMQEMLSLIEANNSTSDFNTQLAREMIDTCTATIFCYGETGAGKSSLIRNLTGDPNAVSSHTTPGTFATVP